MRKYLWIASLLLPLLVGAQVKEPRYTVRFSGGGLVSLGRFGPRETTEVSEVKFLHPVTKSLEAGFDLLVLPRCTAGIELALNEFDYGYNAAPHYRLGGIGIASGLEGAYDRVILYQAGLRLTCQLAGRQRFGLYLFITPSAGYYPYSSALADTTDNAGYRTVSIRKETEVHYIRYVPYQRSGLAAYLKGGLEAQYRIGRHAGVSITCQYQQGFRPFVIDSVNIVRPYEPSGEKQARYWTKVTGTSFQFHAGLFYRF